MTRAGPEILGTYGALFNNIMNDVMVINIIVSLINTELDIYVIMVTPIVIMLVGARISYIVWRP